MAGIMQQRPDTFSHVALVVLYLVGLYPQVLAVKLDGVVKVVLLAMEEISQLLVHGLVLVRDVPVVVLLRLRV